MRLKHSPRWEQSREFLLKIPTSHSMRLKPVTMRTREQAPLLKIPTSHSMRCPSLTLPILKVPKWGGFFFPQAGQRTRCLSPSPNSQNLGRVGEGLFSTLKNRKIWGGDFYPPGMSPHSMPVPLSKFAEFGEGWGGAFFHS